MSEMVDSMESERKTYDPVIPQDGRLRIYPRNLYVDIQTSDQGKVGSIRLQANLDDPASVSALRAKFDEIMEEGT